MGLEKKPIHRQLLRIYQSRINQLAKMIRLVKIFFHFFVFKQSCLQATVSKLKYSEIITEILPSTSSLRSPISPMVCPRLLTPIQSPTSFVSPKVVNAPSKTKKSSFDRNKMKSSFYQISSISSNDKIRYCCFVMEIFFKTIKKHQKLEQLLDSHKVAARCYD